MTALLRAITTLAAPAGEGSRLSVFYFHRTLTAPDPLLPSEPDARTLDRILGWIGSQFRVLDPIEACERLYDSTLPSRPAIITFDDGYRDNFTVALPILQHHRIRAAFFVATGFLGGGLMFNDRVIEAVRRCTSNVLPVPGTTQLLPAASLEQRRRVIDVVLRAVKHLSPEERHEKIVEFEHHAGGTSTRQAPLMMSADEVARLHQAGMRIGGHTRSHPILLKVDDETARSEIQGGIDDLAGITGAGVELFAYPNGQPGRDYDSRHVAMVKATQCRFAFTTSPGPALRSSGSYEIPRFTPWDRSSFRFGLRALLNLRNASR